MRENNLLSPHRCRRRGGNPHDGEIITHAPNLMWGTDGVRVFTVDDGWGWIFTAVEHWNAECVGWHVCKRGDRFAALQPISMGLAGLYGSTAAGAARGLALRMDHGSQYLSDHFTNQIKFWGIQPSYAFVAEPQTNGVAERFNRTLKEQIIHGRIYRNIAELRDAVRDFVELYNAQWIVEKNGYLSPAQARQAWHAAISIRPPRETNLCPRNRVRYTGSSPEPSGQKIVDPRSAPRSWREARGPLIHDPGATRSTPFEKHLAKALHRLALPAAHLVRMHFVLGCDLLDRLVAPQRFQRYAGLEVRREPAPFRHFVSLRYPVEYTLAPCPIFWDQLT